MMTIAVVVELVGPWARKSRLQDETLSSLEEGLNAAAKESSYAWERTNASKYYKKMVMTSVRHIAHSNIYITEAL